MSMRCLLAVGLLASVLALATVTDAHAVVSVDVVWTLTTGPGITGDKTIVALPGDVLTAEVRLNADAGGVSNYALSLEFDRDFGDELDLLSVTELDVIPPFVFAFSPSAVESQQESTPTDVGEIFTFEAAGLPEFGPVSTTIAILIVQFAVTDNVTTDGDDVFSGAFNVGVDAVGDRSTPLNDITSSVVFEGAAVDIVPPIPTPALRPWGLVATSLGLLAALALATRRPSANGPLLPSRRPPR